MEIGIFQDRSYNADQTCWVWGRPEISTLRLVKSTEGTRRACWMHADHENILRDKLHKYAICRRSRFQKMYPTFACSVIIMAFPSRFLCQAGPTPHQGGLRHWRHWDTDSIQFINISFFWAFCIILWQVPAWFVHFWSFWGFWTAGVCFRLQENLGILQRLEHAWHLSVLSKFHTKILRRPHEKQAAYNACSPFREKIMSMPYRHVQVHQVQVVVPAVPAPWLEF